MVTRPGRGLQVRVQPLEPGHVRGAGVLHRAGRELPAEQGLAGEHVPDVVAGQRHHDVAAARLEPDQALGAQLQQALADRGGADPQVLRHGLRADEVPAAQLAGDDQVADVRRGLGAELRAMPLYRRGPSAGCSSRSGKEFGYRVMAYPPPCVSRAGQDDSAAAAGCCPANSRAMSIRRMNATSPNCWA